MADTTAEILNREVKGWASDTRGELKSAQPKAGIEQFTGELFRKVRFRIRKLFGEVSGITFVFPLHGSFVEWGGGRGDREPKPWVNPTLDKETESLANIVVNVKGREIEEKINKELPDKIVLNV